MENNENEIELYCIYVALGQLRSLAPTSIGRLGISQSIFPKRFVFKQINDRLNGSGQLADNLATTLFRRLSSEFEQRNGELVDAPVGQRAESSASGTCPELDEYFHYTLCNMHDFLINLNWHETILESSPSKSDANYIESHLPCLKELIQFRKLLADKNALKMVAAKDPNIPLVAKSSVLSTLDVTKIGPKAIRSSLSKRSPESPGHGGRRVRFNDSQAPDKGVPQNIKRLKKYIRDSHSILALDLTLFALHLFVRAVKRQFSQWSIESTANMKESMHLIRTSKRRLRVNRLISMVKDRQLSNAVHANIMNNLWEIERTYLLDHVLITMCAHDEERLQKLYKQPHVRTFVNEFMRCDEKEVLNLMATQIVEILFELAVCEINMPPIELVSKKRNKPKEGGGGTIKTNQENYLNLVASWLNLDKILFGSRVKAETTIKQVLNSAKQVKDSSAATGFEFKSSSRILNQMDNLHELMRHILADLVDQMNSRRHVDYCLLLLHSGVGQCVELIGGQLETQLRSIKKALLDQQKQALRSETSSAEQHSSPVSTDKVAIKMRYLKLIHISSSMDSLIKELSQAFAINITTDSMVSSRKVSRLIEELTRQMDSI